MQSKAKQGNAKQCNAKQSTAKQSNAMQSYAKQCKAMQCKALQSNAKQSNGKQCKAEQCKAEQCNARQCKAKHSKAKQCWENCTLDELGHIQSIRLLKISSFALTVSHFRWRRAEPVAYYKAARAGRLHCRTQLTSCLIRMQRQQFINAFAWLSDLLREDSTSPDVNVGTAATLRVGFTNMAFMLRHGEAACDLKLVYKNHVLSSGVEKILCVFAYILSNGNVIWIGGNASGMRLECCVNLVGIGWGLVRMEWELGELGGIHMVWEWVGMVWLRREFGWHFCGNMVRMARIWQEWCELME